MIISAAHQTTDYATLFQRWFTDGGLSAILLGVWRFGSRQGQHDNKHDAIDENISDIKDDIRDLRAAVYGYPPRPR
jgi:hypothetical protein